MGPKSKDNEPGNFTILGEYLRHKLESDADKDVKCKDHAKEKSAHSHSHSKINGVEVVSAPWNKWHNQREILSKKYI